MQISCNSGSCVTAQGSRNRPGHPGCYGRFTRQEGHRMDRDIFQAEHREFRDMVRVFLAREVVPHHAQWEADGVVSRDVWLAAGRAGLLGIEIDEKYGGGGTD